MTGFKDTDQAVRPWPVVPPPQPLESLSSWLARIAMVYGLSVQDLLLVENAPVLIGPMVDLDGSPPDRLLAWLARKTGHPCKAIQTMTLSGGIPTLLDGIGVPSAALTAYTANTRLISRVGEPIVVHDVPPWADAAWGLVWGCAGCLAADSIPYRRWPWCLPWMLTCAHHGQYLEKLAVEPGRKWQRINGPFGRVSPDPALQALDRHTWNAVTHGWVEMGGHGIDGGVWLRLLRASLEEVTRIAPDASLRGCGIAGLWEELGLSPPSPGEVSAPYEFLPPRRKLRLMRATALAIERSRSLLTDWMDGNGPALLDPEADLLRRVS